jgi:hypothetical protein
MAPGKMQQPSMHGRAVNDIDKAPGRDSFGRSFLCHRDADAVRSRHHAQLADAHAQHDVSDQSSREAIHIHFSDGRTYSLNTGIRSLPCRWINWSAIAGTRPPARPLEIGTTGRPAGTNTEGRRVAGIARVPWKVASTAAHDQRGPGPHLHSVILACGSCRNATIAFM